MKLTPEYAQRLFETGAFVVFSGLPTGSEVGIDGDVHLTRKFSGWKMIPPGLHLVTWSIPSSNQQTPGIQIRRAALRHLVGGQTYVLKYSAEAEDLVPNIVDEATGEEIPTTISPEHLRALDGELAAYPLFRWTEWKTLTEGIEDADIVRLLGNSHKVDSLYESPADDEVIHKGEVIDNTTGLPATMTKDIVHEGQLAYVPFDIKRSWRKGAVGEEVTTYSRDKSWLLCHVIKEHFAGEPARLLAQLQLAFLIFINVQNFSSLLAFKRFLVLLSRSQRIFFDDELLAASGITNKIVEKLYTRLFGILAAQLSSLPETFFSVDLAGTGMQDFWQDELQALCHNVGRVPPAGTVQDSQASPMRESLSRLKAVAMERFQLNLETARFEEAASEEELEEGEDAPVVVEL
ncbi:hypothetical protein QFC22_003277 [Naganishia vaughanmartiniae]|uniref:Uncharacterized protein n=1 Tax=Naganishia vaughanmartiniae TaxID=1424756 RepID=A0ACC2X7G7_9TREE|nr:hypothetical protein QFC22_003277 [Naganishia vaughanmartiniae]